MFGWFAPKCPLDTVQKCWTERRMRWLADRLGIERMRKAPLVHPTEEYFPDPYDGSKASIRRYFDRVCGYMGVPAHTLTMEVRPDDHLPGAAGLYERGARSNICIAQSQIDDPMRLVATIAHEVAHEVLLGGNLLDASTPDHEDVTDLLTVFLGMGVFPANATVRHEAYTTGNWSFFSINKQGYLSSMALGYALALFAFVREDTSVRWASHLRPDAAGGLKAGLRYLEKTGDTLFDATAASVPLSRPKPADLVEHLQSRSATVRLNAVWDVAEHEVKEFDVMVRLQGCLDDPDADIPGEAARALADFGPAAAAAVPKLVDTLWSPNASTRTGAATALGAIRQNPDVVVPELAALLAEGDPPIVTAAAEAITCFEGDGKPAVPKILPALEQALNSGNVPLIHTLLGTLRAVIGDPFLTVRDYFKARDADLARLALDMLREFQQQGHVP